MEWLAFHVFHPEPVEALLLDCVGGLHRRLTQEQRIRRFFFIRYAEAGYHVRLRFELSSGTEMEPVRRSTAAALRDYLDAHDGSGVRIVEAPYEPELARYGGPAGVDVAETHFDFSSAMAMAILQRTRALGPTCAAVRVGLALEAMLALPHGFGLSPAAIAELFRGYYRGTLDVMKMSEPPAAFAAAAAAQQARLRVTARRVFARDEPPGPWAAAWIDEGAGLAARLAAHGVCPASTELTQVSGILLSSYLHMFVNRLGFSGGPEAALCHLAQDVCGGAIAAPARTGEHASL